MNNKKDMPVFEPFGASFLLTLCIWRPSRQTTRPSPFAFCASSCRFWLNHKIESVTGSSFSKKLSATRGKSNESKRLPVSQDASVLLRNRDKESC